MPPPEGIDFQLVPADVAAGHIAELAAVYREVYAEPPYEWGGEHVELFVERFAVQHRDGGFSLVEGRYAEDLIAFGFGVTLAPTTPWWSHLVTPLPDDVTREYVDRTFALVELLVRSPWRRKHVGKEIHDRLVDGRYEERATLTVLPAAAAAHAAYAKWGWHKVTQKRNPLPGSPVFDVMVRELETLSAGGGRGL